MTTTLLPRRLTIFQYLLSVLAFANVAILCLVVANHLRFPLNLEAMETTVLEHVRRAMLGQPIYSEPTAQFTPLAYNPLYYYVCAFFARFLGLSLTTLREVTLVATAGCAALLYFITVRETRSKWWGIMSLGLFAASYQALDSYYDVGHRDTWVVFLVLGGCYLMGYSETRLRDFFGMLFLVAAFWMKQQGAVFVLGGLAYLLWRDLGTGAKWHRSWPSAAVAAAFGPVLYLLLPAQVTGPAFHYFTWDVPSRWAEITPDEIRSFAEWIARRFAIPAALAGAGLQLSLDRGRPLGIWFFFLPIAFLSALLATLTPGSNMNVFMPLGVWLILTAVLALPRLARAIPWFEQLHFPAGALLLAMVALSYRPTMVMVREAESKFAYNDLSQYLEQLDGQVYAPWVGQMPTGAKLKSAAHWVPLEDMERGPGATQKEVDLVHHILRPAVNPAGKAWILHNTPLRNDPLLSYLADSYVLEQDLGNRFQALECVPRRYTGLWPRYLYRYDPRAALRLSASRARPIR